MIHVVIMAGGKGTRFWPLSRSVKAKQFLNLITEKSLIQETIARVSDWIPSHQRWIVGNLNQGGYLEELHSDVPATNILLEPIGKNTAPCIGWAALEIQKRDPEAIMVVLSADHFISPKEAFIADLKLATEEVEANDTLVTLGIQPTSPHTGYGYIETKEQHNNILPVLSFKEKPAEETAETYLDKGGYYWNSGIFVWKASTILSLLESHQEEDMKLLKLLVKDTALLHQKYFELKGTSIDYGVMEHAADRTRLIPASFEWDDIGSWNSIAKFWLQDDDGNAVHSGNVTGIGSKNNIIHNPGKHTALIDVDDMIIVNAEDSLLVAKRSSGQKIKTLYDQLDPELQ